MNRNWIPVLRHQSTSPLVVSDLNRIYYPQIGTYHCAEGSCVWKVGATAFFVLLRARCTEAKQLLIIPEVKSMRQYYIPRNIWKTLLSRLQERRIKLSSSCPLLSVSLDIADTIPATSHCDFQSPRSSILPLLELQTVFFLTQDCFLPCYCSPVEIISLPSPVHNETVDLPRLLRSQPLFARR